MADKGTDYSSEVLEQHEKPTTFTMRSAWRKDTGDDSNSRGRQYGKFVKRHTSHIIIKNNNGQTVHLTIQ